MESRKKIYDRKKCKKITVSVQRELREDHPMGRTIEVPQWKENHETEQFGVDIKFSRLYAIKGVYWDRVALT